MDLTILFLIVSLVFVGAYFIGYPIGKIVGRRQKLREIENVNFVYPLPECVAKAKKNIRKDILDAEILEVKNG